MLQQILFALLLLAVVFLSVKLYGRIRKNILLGQPEKINTPTATRWRKLLLVAFGQQKMFKRWIPAVLHLFIYVAFLLTQIELIEIIADGLSGEHRLFAEALGGFYTFLINFVEILSILAFVGTIAFLWRRNVMKVSRVSSRGDLHGWPITDANLILLGEILLITGIFTMNAADGVLQARGVAHYPDTGHLLLSSILGESVFADLSTNSLIGLERFGWWLHILVVFGFILYLPFSKHLHIFFAFINSWNYRDIPRGRMQNMEEITREVKSMLGMGEGGEEMPMDEEIPEFGAKDVFDLSWKNILDAYTCTECGRCTAVCPANITGKKLSPRKIMMDIRDRAEEVGRNLRLGYLKRPGQDEEKHELSPEKYDDGKSLFDYISPEELHACTTCNACVEACPVLINPLEPILMMRRYEILTESKGPQEWMPMFSSMESSGSPWQVPESRDHWAKEARKKQ